MDAQSDDVVKGLAEPVMAPGEVFQCLGGVRREHPASPAAPG